MGRRSIKTLLSQGAAGGAWGCFLMICGLILAFPNANNFLWAFVLPICVVCGVGIGAGAGAAIWALEGGVERNWRILSRLAVSILFTIPFFVLLSYGQESHDRALLSAAASVFGLSILLFTSSNIRPWRLIARGTAEPLRLKILFSRGPIRISRTIEELGHSLLAGLPLRASSLFALMVSLLLGANTLSFFWRDQWSYQSLQDLNEVLAATAYFGATVGVSFAARSKWVVLAMAAAINAPWAAWVLPDRQSIDTFLPTILVFFFFALWLLFVLGIVFSPVKKGELQVEYGHTEIRFGKQQWVKESQ